MTHFLMQATSGAGLPIPADPSLMWIIALFALSVLTMLFWMIRAMTTTIAEALRGLTTIVEKKLEDEREWQIKCSTEHAQILESLRGCSGKPSGDRRS